MLRSWVKDWLRYCRWYYMVALAPTVDLEDFFKVKTDPELVRFGILWKVFDMVANKGTDFSVPILEPLSELTCCASFPCLLGGAKGTDFVVLSLSQPKAGRGWVASLYTPNECRVKVHPYSSLSLGIRKKYIPFALIVIVVSALPSASFDVFAIESFRSSLLCLCCFPSDSLCF